MGNKVYLDMGYDMDPDTGDISRAIIDKERYIPDSHIHFLHFLEADLEAVKEVLERAAKEGKGDLAGSACDMLCSVHPYFERPDRAASYVNGTLAQILLSGGGTENEDAGPLFARLGRFIGGMMPDLDSWVASGEGKGTVQGLARLQSDLRHMASIVFDDAGGLSACTRAARNGLYGLVSTDACQVPVIRIPQCRIILPVPGAAAGLRAAMDFDDGFAESIYAMVKEFEEGKGPVPDELKKIMERMSEKGEEESRTEYDTPYLEDVLSLEVSEMVKDGARIGRCARCGRRFVMSADNPSFCSFPGKDGITCLQAHILEERKKEAGAAYTQAYRTRFARMTAGKGTKESLDAWRAEAKKLRDQAQKGTMPMEQYIEKLKSL